MSNDTGNHLQTQVIITAIAMTVLPLYSKSIKVVCNMLESVPSGVVFRSEGVLVRDGGFDC